MSKKLRNLNNRNKHRTQDSQKTQKNGKPKIFINTKSLEKPNDPKTHKKNKNPK